MNLASVDLNQILTDHQAHTYAFMVHFGGPLQLAKQLEELGDVLRLNTFAVVYDADSEHLLRIVVRGYNLNSATHGELKRILDQVYQNLL